VQNTPKETIMSKLVGLLLLLGFSTIQASPVHKQNPFFWEDQSQGYYKLDEQAYTFVGLPFTTDTSNVTIIIIDGWDDGHGQTVEAIIRRGAQNANVVRMDFVFPSFLCPTDPFSAYVICAQDIIADLVERAANSDGLTIVNMSLGLYYVSRNTYSRLIEKKGCDNSSKINLDSLKRIRDAIVGSQTNILWVAAAGNYGVSNGVGFPACLDRVYSVASLKREYRYDPQDLKLASYSNYSLRGRSYAEPIGGVMRGDEGIEFEGTSFATPLLSAILANIVAMCYHEPPKLNPGYVTQEGMRVLTIWSAEC
jgi:hypothetical protein